MAGEPIDNRRVTRTRLTSMISEASSAASAPVVLPNESISMGRAMFSLRVGSVGRAAVCSLEIPGVLKDFMGGH